MCGVKLQYSDRNYVELLEESDNWKVLAWNQTYSPTLATTGKDGKIVLPDQTLNLKVSN